MCDAREKGGYTYMCVGGFEYIMYPRYAHEGVRRPGADEKHTFLELHSSIFGASSTKL